MLVKKRWGMNLKYWGIIDFELIFFSLFIKRVLQLNALIDLLPAWYIMVYGSLPKNTAQKGPPSPRICLTPHQLELRNIKI